MTTLLIFAKKGDDADVLFGVIVMAVAVVVALVSAVIRGPARYHLTIKAGLPYCPVCNRQVSYRRDVCRACGYTFKTYAPTAPQGTGERVARRVARREAREATYRERGIKPGPLAWFRVLPEWQQAVFLGLAIAAPVVGLIVFLMR